MATKTAYSILDSAKDAAMDIKKQLEGITPTTIIFFSSTKYDMKDLNSEMKKNFKDSKIFGCSTSGEIVTGKMLKNSVVAMALDNTTVSDLKIEVVEKIKTKNNVNKAFSSFEKYFKTSQNMLE